MKQLDTDTVLEIIRMIDNKILNIPNPSAIPTKNLIPRHYHNAGQIRALMDLQDHLQIFIDAQLNAVENQSPEQ